MALERQDIPFRITSGLRFFDQAHIKDVCAFMRLIVNPQDEVSFLRLAKMVHRIGESSAGRLWNLWRTKSAEGFRRPEFRPSNILLELPVPKAASESWQQLAYTLDELVSNGSFLPPRDMIRSIAQGFYEDVLRTAYPNYERRMEDIEQFASYAANFDSTEMLLSDLSLLSSAADQETVEQGQEREAVVLSTVHQAKGLEWDAVFIVWLTAGMFPNQRALSEDLHEGESSSAVEEERRLFYVAATRARDHLYLTCPRVWPDSRTGDFYQARSPFLLELPHSTYEEWPHGAPV
jgi:DNA helicase-2/ATP-dependent DNA helicase PcrA